MKRDGKNLRNLGIFFDDTFEISIEFNFIVKEFELLIPIFSNLVLELSLN